MKAQKFYIQSFFLTERFTLPMFQIWFICILVSSLSTGNIVNAQNGLPEFAPPVDDPFGLMSPPGVGATWLRLVDIDHDDTLEAFAVFFSPFDPAGGSNLDYYENLGSNEAPAFVFEETYPFGIQENSLDFMYHFMDIDGDGFDELFFLRWDYDTPIKMLQNIGTLTEPDYGGTFLENPFGITTPVSDIDGGLLDRVAPVFGDIDNDGDLDLFYGGEFVNSFSDEGLFFLENIDPSGNGTDPQFAEPIKNPFGIAFLPAGAGNNLINLADIDCDEDLDLFHAGGGINFYFENTGTTTTPDFSNPQQPLDSPFGGNWGSFVDIGNDGDLDFISGEAKFYENISPAPAADFIHTKNGLEVSFMDLSTAPNPNSVSKWLWDFGDGTTSQEQNPTHTFAEEDSYQVCLTVWYLCRSDQFCEPIDISVGTQESYLEADFRLYPNPANDEFILEIESKESFRNPEILIFDVLGRSVRKWSYTLSGTTIKERLNLSGLESGIYMVKVQTSDKILAKQFVKK